MVTTWTVGRTRPELWGREPWGQPPWGRRPETRRAPPGTIARRACESANGFGHAYVLPEEVPKGDGLATFAKARHPALGRHGE